MKVKIEIEEGLAEEEVTIRCPGLNDTVIALQNYISMKGRGKRCLSLKSGETEFFVPIEEIYFFETEGRDIRAHTADKIFVCSYKLYELEELLPGSFMRISKSTVANLDFVYSITRNLTASSVMEFTGTRKKVMVSRAYFKAVTERVKERKLGSRRSDV
ncbi:MAG: LytTR family transcriptional regulator [Lachnospiraceae bacterium]|nr:LytTR family transcriptional regulator [Lachnospiraceae bacterium]